MDRLRVGVVGLGAFGKGHLRAYHGAPQVEIVAAASRSGARACEVARQYGIPRWHEGYQSLIDDPAIDAISVTTAGAETLDVSYEPMLHGAVSGALRDELSAFATSALAGTAPTVVAPEDGLATLVVVLAAIESAERDVEITVNYPAALG